MQGTLVLGPFTLAVRVAALDHLVGIDLRLDRPDRLFTLLLGVPFLSLKVALANGRDAELPSSAFEGAP